MISETTIEIFYPMSKVELWIRELFGWDTGFEATFYREVQPNECDGFVFKPIKISIDGSSLNEYIIASLYLLNNYHDISLKLEEL